MKVLLRNPRREVEVPGGRRVKDILRDLDIIPETVLVILGDTLITHDRVVEDHDTIELRPVMSGGTGLPAPGAARFTPASLARRARCGVLLPWSEPAARPPRQ